MKTSELIKVSKTKFQSVVEKCNVHIQDRAGYSNTRNFFDNNGNMVGQVVGYYPKSRKNSSGNVPIASLSYRYYLTKNFSEIICI